MYISDLEKRFNFAQKVTTLRDAPITNISKITNNMRDILKAMSNLPTINLLNISLKKEFDEIGGDISKPPEV